MKQNCRILVGLSCPFSCSYCCNKNTELLSKFQTVNFAELTRLITMYQSVSVSGGEPLSATLITKAMTVIAYASSCKKRVYLYTNISCFEEEHMTPDRRQRLAKELTGWSIGYHPTQIHDTMFMDRLKRLMSYSPVGVRIIAEDSVADNLSTMLQAEKIPFPVKPWKRDECDISDKEDWFIWR